jgi:hypothetical protein
MLCWPRCYSHVTIARVMTHHYSRVTKKRVTAYQCCMDCGHLTPTDYSFVTKIEGATQRPMKTFVCCQH